MSIIPHSEVPAYELQGTTIVEEDLPMAQDYQESRTLYSLYLPVTDNAGRPFQEELEWVWATLARTVGSYTALPPGTGCWIDAAGMQFCEPIVVLQVVCPASRETEAFFAQLARELAVRLRQQEIFLFSQPISYLSALGGTGGTAHLPPAQWPLPSWGYGALPGGHKRTQS